MNLIPQISEARYFQSGIPQLIKILIKVKRGQKGYFEVI